ncbi:ArgS-related anticodon-binding protein NrtL [Streptomyces sp. DH12]|uniref:ArgS-related anticodon-binding protein NrtL n=1 Tax=Streptomyces sp. DH12 TaxID=2857010 RepID=UPI001E556645|nr:DALR anticodon-binding domain-containing protein [Streptomyces sp. DH12]
MTPADLSLTVLRAVRRAVGDGALRVADVPARVVVERPRPGGRGDWATNAALQLAGPAALPPRQVAEVLRERLLDAPGIAAVDITGPGFLNLTLRAGARADADRLLLRRVLDEGRRYGYGDALAGLPADEVVFRNDAGRTGHRGAAPGAPEAPFRTSRVAVLAEAVVALLRSQGAPARIAPGGRRPAAVPAHYDVDAVLGPDARRWALLRPAPHDRVLDPGPLLRQVEAPGALFTVQYAHARARALVRNAADLGFDGGRGAEWAAGRDLRAEDPHAAALLTALADHPAVLLAAARQHAPDRFARQLEAVADALLGFQHTVLPRGDEKPSAAHRCRLALAEAAGAVLAGGLSLLGISAPEHL